jgi:ABC-type multidrug transport system ATPase subunit
MLMSVLAAHGLTIARGRRVVLRDVALELERGAIVHLSGANGSGKTSLMRVLAGIARARGGRLERTGTCAYVPERVQLAPVMRPGEWLAAMHRLRGLDAVDWPVAAKASGLDPAVLRRPASSLSKGMLQRVALLEALQARPALLLLDEPFSGLDTTGREWLAQELKDGPAVLLTDHSGTADPTERLLLRDGRCAPIDRIARLTIAASHPDGRRLERTAGEDESDALLEALLREGWHVERVER